MNRIDFDFAFTVTNTTPSNRVKCIQQLLQLLCCSECKYLRSAYKGTQKLRCQQSATRVTVDHRVAAIVRSASLINAPNDAPLKTIRGSRFWIMHPGETNIGDELNRHGNYSTDVIRMYYYWYYLLQRICAIKNLGIIVRVEYFKTFKKMRNFKEI